MLTRKQKELYDYLVWYEPNGCPSYREMALALGLKSKSGIHRLVLGLEERGYIRRLPHRQRAIEALRNVEERTEDVKLFFKVVHAAENLKTRYHDHKLTVTPESYKALKKALKEYRA